MNEFIVKKLAEVQAFNGLGKRITDQAGDGFTGSAPDVADALRTLSTHDLSASIPDSHRGLFETKTGKTDAKLGAMMELYVKDEWDNPVEVLEWTSFFAGAGAAHAALTAAATEVCDPELSARLDGLAAQYRSLLDTDMAQLRLAAVAKRI